MRSSLILVIEDEHELLDVLKLVLEAAGYDVLAATDGEQALRLLERVTPSATLCDLVMPVMDGLQFIAAYRERYANGAPIIAMSALKPFLLEARKLGVEGTIEKPFAFDTVESTLARVLRGEQVRAMSASPASEDAREADRLRALLSLGLDDEGGSAALDDLADRTARQFGVPICLINVMFGDRQVWKAQHGLPMSLASRGGAPRDEGFCTHAVDGRALLVVSDAAQHPVFQRMPLVVEHGVRFYAGVPLVTRFGDAVGTLCLLDYRPREVTCFDLDLLKVLGRRVMAELEANERSRSPQAPVSTFGALPWFDAHLGVLGRDALAEALKAEIPRAKKRGERVTFVATSVPKQSLRGAAAALSIAFPTGFVGRLGPETLGVVVTGADPVRAMAVTRDALRSAYPLFAQDVRLAAPAEWLFRDAETALGRGTYAREHSERHAPV